MFKAVYGRRGYIERGLGEQSKPHKGGDQGDNTDGIDGQPLVGSAYGGGVGPTTAGVMSQSVLAAQIRQSGLGAVQLGSAYLLARLSGPGRFAQAQAWLAATYAAGQSLTTLACGPIYVRYGETGYLFMAAMAATGFGLALGVMRRLETGEKRAEAAAAATGAG
jgi:hypothetical protein